MSCCCDNIIEALDDGVVVAEDVQKFSFDGGIVATQDPSDPNLVHVALGGIGAVSLQIAYDGGEVIVTTAVDGPVEIHRGATAPNPALLLDTPYPGAVPAGDNKEILQAYEDFGGANQTSLQTFDSNLNGAGWPITLRKTTHDVAGGHIPKGLVVGDDGMLVQNTSYLRIVGWSWGNGLKQYLDIGPYNFGMSMETSASILELFIGGGANPTDAGSSVLSVRHRSGGSVVTQGSRIEARDDNDTGGFTISCEYDTPRLYNTNTPGGLSVKDILYTALGGSSAAARGQHRFQRKSSPTAGISMVGATEAADVYSRGYVATIRVDAIPASGETGFVLDSVPPAGFVAERVSLTEPVSNATQVSGGTFRSEGRFWNGAAAATHFGDLKFEAISGINEGRRWTMYDDTTAYVGWRWGGGADTYWQAIGGGRVFLQDFAGNNAMVFHQGGIIEVDALQSRTTSAYKIASDGDAVFGAFAMASTEKLYVVGGTLAVMIDGTTTGTEGPELRLRHNDGQIGVAADELGRISGWGADGTTPGTMREYARLHPIIGTATAGNIAGGWSFWAPLTNSMAKFLEIYPGNGVVSSLAGAFYLSDGPTIGEGGGNGVAHEFSTTANEDGNYVVLAVSDGLGANYLLKAKGDGDLEVTQDIEAAGGYRDVVGIWTHALIANQTDIAMTRTGTTTDDYLCGRSGSITGIRTRTDAAVSAGTLTINVRVGGAIVFTSAITATSTVTTQAKDTDTFVSGNLITVSYTTSAAFAGPIVANVEVEIEQ